MPEDPENRNFSSFRGMSGRDGTFFLWKFPLPFPLFHSPPFSLFSPFPSFPLFSLSLFFPLSPLFPSFLLPPLFPFSSLSLLPFFPLTLLPSFPFSPLPCFPPLPTPLSPSFPLSLTPLPSFPLSPLPSFPSPLSARLSPKNCLSQMNVFCASFFAPSLLIFVGFLRFYYDLVIVARLNTQSFFMSQFIVHFLFLFSSIHWMVVFNNKHTWARCADVSYNVCDSHGNVSLCPLLLFKVKHSSIVYVWKLWQILKHFPKKCASFVCMTDWAIGPCVRLIAGWDNKQWNNLDGNRYHDVCFKKIFWPNLSWNKERRVLRCHQQTQILHDHHIFQILGKTGLRPHVRPKQDFHKQNEESRLADWIHSTDEHPTNLWMDCEYAKKACERTGDRVNLDVQAFRFGDEHPHAQRHTKVVIHDLMLYLDDYIMIAHDLFVEDFIWSMDDNRHTESKSCNPGRPLQESPGPSGPGIPKESPKSLPGPSGPRGPKSVQNSLKTVSGVSKQSISRLRRLFLDCFG